MNKIILFAFLVFTITGLLTPSIFSSSFASSADAPGRDKGTKTANGCYNGTAKNNPNCMTDTDGDGIPDDEDACIDLPNLYTANGLPDHDGDGLPDNSDPSPCG